MPRPDRLTEEQISRLMEELPLWVKQENTIVREFVASNFPAAIGMINAIAVLAESADHHPDLLIYGWNKVRVTLSTHDRGGLTQLDFGLAAKIEQLNY